ncbi:DUF2934 domain-containing protein [Rhizobium sp. RAF56]|uniref:DUF2934 domain-containing protein n=1 Tax=Rhizobium sp. RAF56 TaxID=3233062 RepID=UPI003F95A9F7
MALDKHEQIRRRAYEIWENEGRPDGFALRHWQQASDELGDDQEHETLQDLIDEDDRDDAALLQGAGESGALDAPRLANANRDNPSEVVAEVDITTGKRPAKRQIKRTEGS